MRKFIVLAALLTLVGCETTNSVVDQNVFERGNQHVAVGVLLAMYYCDKNEWPPTLDDLRSYYEEKEITLPSAPDWVLATSPGAIYQVEQNVTFKTPAGEEELGEIAVSSIHKYPGCENGNIDARPHINLGS